MIQETQDRENRASLEFECMRREYIRHRTNPLVYPPEFPIAALGRISLREAHGEWELLRQSRQAVFWHTPLRPTVAIACTQVGFVRRTPHTVLTRMCSFKILCIREPGLGPGPGARAQGPRPWLPKDPYVLP